VKNNFGDEAYGLCRSCVELQLTVRYLTNKDAINRTNRYFRYYAKDKSDWFRLIKKYGFDGNLPIHPDKDHIEQIAATYKSPHKWSECETSLRTCPETMIHIAFAHMLLRRST
jgi:hypothetical protein